MHQIRQRTQTNTRPYFTCGGLSSEEMTHEEQSAKHSKVQRAGVLNIDGWGFDIRILEGIIYCHGLPVDEFISECMLTPEEELLYRTEITNWALNEKA
jgi:hypothetical protein